MRRKNKTKETITIDVNDFDAETRSALEKACMTKQKFLNELISEIIEDRLKKYGFLSNENNVRMKSFYRYTSKRN